MTEYVGCEHVRSRLDALVDGELSVEQQVPIESHLRWCRTCAAHVEDLRLIRASLRFGSPVHLTTGDVSHALGVISEGVLTRIRAERAQSVQAQLREMFADMRLLWPALGASTAVALCLVAMFAVLQQTSNGSLSTMIESLDPGTEQNPMRPDDMARFIPFAPRDPGLNRIAGGVSLPFLMENDVTALDGIPQEDAVFAVATVVNREGRIATYELLNSQPGGAAVLNAVRRQEFAPAQTPAGRTVAVNMVWLIVVTTAQKADPRDVAAASQLLQATTPRRVPEAETVAPPVTHESARETALTTV